MLSGSPNDGLSKHSLVWDEFSIYKGKQRDIELFRIGKKSEKESQTYQNPVKVALEYKEILEYGLAESQTDLAGILGVSKSRVTQLLNLLELDEEIQEFMLGLEDTDERLKVLTERRLRQISKIIDSEHQKDEFLKII